MMYFVEPAGADVQLHFLHVHNQVVFYCRYPLSWRPLHCLSTFGRRQCFCIVRPSAMECFYNIEFVCSYRLPHAADIWWRQFGCALMHNEELYNQPHHSHPQALHLSPFDQLLWRHLPSLQEGSLKRVAHRFLGMKNDCMQIKAKQFDFRKTNSTKIISIVFELLRKWKTNRFH